MKEKAIEICINLTHTINTMNDSTTTHSESTAFISSKAKKSTLLKQRKKLMEKYDLTLNDLK